MIIETMKVKRDGPKGYHIINKDSFDPAIHELYESKKQVPTEAKSAKQTIKASGEKS